MCLSSSLNLIGKPKSYVAVTASSFTLSNCPCLIFDWIIRAYLHKDVGQNRRHSSMSARSVLGLPININFPLPYIIHVIGSLRYFKIRTDFFLRMFDSCGSRMSKFSLILYTAKYTLLLYLFMISTRNTIQTL